MMQVEELEPLVGEWTVEAKLPPDLTEVVRGRTTFEWLWRDDQDFAHRYSGRLSADGSTIEGAWERCGDGETWEHDFDLTYTKVV